MKASDKRLITTVIRDAILQAEHDVRTRLSKLKDVTLLEEEREKLKLQVETLKIEKARKDEEHERKERELEHKLGLHKLQVDEELKHALASAKLDAQASVQTQREENFKEQMKFVTEQFDELLERQDGLLKQIIERLPSAEILAHIGEAPRRKEERDGS